MSSVLTGVQCDSGMAAAGPRDEGRTKLRPIDDDVRNEAQRSQELSHGPQHHRRRRSSGAEVKGASFTAIVAAGARVFGPSAMAPIAIAALALGAIAIARIAIADAVIRRLRVGEIEIRSLKVHELEVAGRRWPEPEAQS